MHRYILTQLEAIAAEWDNRPDALPEYLGRTRNVGGLFKGGDRRSLHRARPESAADQDDRLSRPRLHR